MMAGQSMLRVKLKIEESHMIMVVDKHTPCQQLLPLIHSKLRAMNGFENSYIYYDKIQIYGKDGLLYDFLDNGPIEYYLDDSDYLKVSSTYVENMAKQQEIEKLKLFEKAKQIQESQKLETDIENKKMIENVISNHISIHNPNIDANTKQKLILWLFKNHNISDLLSVIRNSQFVASIISKFLAIEEQLLAPMQQQQQKPASMSQHLQRLQKLEESQLQQEQQRLMVSNDVSVETSKNKMNEMKEDYLTEYETKEETISVRYNLIDNASKLKQKCNFIFVKSIQDISNHIVAINMLIEILPNNCIVEIFNFFNFDCTPYIQHGWSMNENKDSINDYPIIYTYNADNIINQPSLIITIGMPGSGKTTWAKERCHETKSAHDFAREKNKLNIYRKNYPSSVIAADDYFTMFNNDEYDVSLISKAHEWCKTQIFNKLLNGQTVIANNTHITLQEMNAYVVFVLFSNLPHKIVFAIMPQFNIDILAKRNAHNVPKKKIKQMRDNFYRWYNKGKPSINSVLKAGPFRRFNRDVNRAKEFLYNGIFFDEKCAKKLQEYFVGITGNALLSKLQNDNLHVTLKFEPNWNDINATPFGKEVEIVIIGYCSNNFIQCVVVDIIASNKEETNKIRNLCSNKYPHITIAFDKDYGKPQYSNDILQYGTIVPLIHETRNKSGIDAGSLRLKGVCGAFGMGKTGIVLTQPNAQTT